MLFICANNIELFINCMVLKLSVFANNIEKEVPRYCSSQDAVAVDSSGCHCQWQCQLPDSAEVTFQFAGSVHPAN